MTTSFEKMNTIADAVSVGQIAESIPNFGIKCYPISMNRDMIISTLRAHQDELNSLGVKSLALFGSVARGQARSDADIDIAALYDDSVVRDLMDMGAVAAAIESYLGTDNFDLANEANLSPHIRGQFTREHVRIF